MSNTVPSSSDISQDNRLAFLHRELRRLQKHPDLFGSDSSKFRFSCALSQNAMIRFSTASKHLLAKQELRSSDKKIRNKKLGESLEDLKPWELYLRNFVPATSEPIKRTNPETTVQWVTPVGMATAQRFVSGENALIQKYKNVCYMSPWCGTF